uniref:CLU central domain-containing protein n=1 Tax=Timema bartmani TaxID=61472 RepID=A0A7R9ES46_9NEOP|nr:unnamed protein product [Timema bartmani]
MMFIKYAAFHLQQLGVKKQREIEEKGKDMNGEKEDNNKLVAFPDLEKSCKELEASSSESQIDADSAKKIVESITDSITSGEKKELEENTKEIVRKAAEAVGSLKETEFDVRFNPDVYSPGVNHVDPTNTLIKKQRQLVRDAADFLVTVQIPTFIRDCLDHTAAPMDGVTLAEALHNRGINIRYLGKIAQMLAKVKQLEYLYDIVVAELLIRAAKHVFTAYMQVWNEMECLEHL